MRQERLPQLRLRTRGEVGVGVWLSLRARLCLPRFGGSSLSLWCDRLFHLANQRPPCRVLDAANRVDDTSGYPPRSTYGARDDRPLDPPLGGMERVENPKHPPEYSHKAARPSLVCM